MSTVRCAGRALAGMKGNTDARILCQDLQAEPSRWRGHARVSEHPRELRGVARPDLSGPKDSQDRKSLTQRRVGRRPSHFGGGYFGENYCDHLGQRGGSARRPRPPRWLWDWRNAVIARSIIDFDVGLRNLDLIMGCERRRLRFRQCHQSGGQSQPGAGFRQNAATATSMCCPPLRQRQGRTDQRGRRSCSRSLPTGHFIVCDSRPGSSMVRPWPCTMLTTPSW